MRGFIIPKDVDWAHCARVVAKESNPHFALEQITMGPLKKVDAHLIVPTCFSMHIDEARGVRLQQQLWSRLKPEVVVILAIQDFITQSCCFCSRRVPHDSKRPYQVALRLIGCSAMNAYDLLMGVLCRTCQTRPFHVLALIDETSYVPIARNLAMYAFGSNVDLSSAEADITPTDLFAYRLQEANRHCFSIAYDVFTTSDEDEYASVCYHCGRTSHVDPSKDKTFDHCTECGVISFCSENAPPHGNRCHVYAAIYHGQTCKELKRGLMFHVNDSMYVDGSGETVLLGAAEEHSL